MNKTRTAQLLGVSRPTLDKMLKNGTKITTLVESRLVVSALSFFPTATPTQIEDFLEWMQDNRMLTEGGEELRHLIWEEFIKEGYD